MNELDVIMADVEFYSKNHPDDDTMYIIEKEDLKEIIQRLLVHKDSTQSNVCDLNNCKYYRNKINTSGVDIQEHFEANLLDGQDIDDCGKSMIDAKYVLEYIQENYGLKPKVESVWINTITGEKRLFNENPNGKYTSPAEPSEQVCKINKKPSYSDLDISVYNCSEGQCFYYESDRRETICNYQYCPRCGKKIKRLD